MKEYTCTSCDWYGEFEFDSPLPKGCPVCGSGSCRIVFRTHTKVQSVSCNIDGTSRNNVRHSYSLGCRPWQLEKMQKLHPGARFVKKGKGYVMEIKSRQEKLQRMKERGYEEYDKGVKPPQEQFSYKGDR